jgi:hypothetical protein
MSKRNTQNSVYQTKGDSNSGQFVLDGTAQNAATFIQRFYAEVGPSKGNGFDSYCNANGPVRNDFFAGISSQGLGKIALIALDSLNTHLNNGDKDAATVLEAIRGYDKIAAEQAELRKRDAARQNLAKLAAEAGLPVDEVHKFLGIAPAAPTPVPAVTVPETEPVAEVEGEPSEVADEADEATEGEPVAEETATNA